MARILIVGGGCRGRLLAAELADAGHAVRITTREERGRAAIEAIGAECWIGTPDRLGTLRGALENATLACWLLGSSSGSARQLEELHGSRLRAFVRQLIDTTVRGLIYEAARPAVPVRAVGGGEQPTVRGLAQHNAIPATPLTADPADTRECWRRRARPCGGCWSLGTRTPARYPGK